MKRLLLWLPGVLILGAIALLLFSPGDAASLTIALLLLLGAIVVFVFYRRIKYDE